MILTFTSIVMPKRFPGVIPFYKTSVIRINEKGSKYLRQINLSNAKCVFAISYF